MMTTMKATAIIALAILLLGYHVVVGQDQSYHRSETNLSRLSVPDLSVKPPLRSDMPADIKATWIIADSICRSVRPEGIETYLKNTSDDTVRLAAKHLFRLQSYDDIMKDKYSREVAEDESYMSNLDYITWKVFEQYSSRFGMSYLDSNIWRMSRIYTVTVSGKESFPEMVGSFDSCINHCVYCTVDSVLKGSVMYDHCKDVTSDNRCAIFSWTSGDTIRTTLRDWNLMFPEDALEVGSSYLVFVFDYMVGGENSYLTSLYYLSRVNGRSVRGSPGYFRIVNNAEVRDPGEFFGLGKNPSLHDVLTLINGVMARYQ